VIRGRGRRQGTGGGSGANGATGATGAGGQGTVAGPEPVVRVEGLTRRFGPLTAVDGVTFDIGRGEMFGLIGPDGAGKTTTLRLILGLLAPQAGTVRACGVDPQRRRRELSRRVGYLSQRFSLYGDLSVDENVAFFAEIHGVRAWRPRRDELLETLRLAPFRDRLADRLSGGMKQKLALACTLIHTPELLVLDEPTTGVDPVSRREFWRILGGLQREGLTLLLTTPYLDEAERCARVALMNRGRILEAGAPARLREMRGAGMLEFLARPRAAARDLLRARPEVLEVETFGERLHVTLRAGGEGPAAAPDGPGAGSGPLRTLESALRGAGVEVVLAREIAPSLEDAFIARVQAEEPSGAGTPGPVGAGAGGRTEAGR